MYVATTSLWSGYKCFLEDVDKYVLPPLGEAGYCRVRGIVDAVLCHACRPENGIVLCLVTAPGDRYTAGENEQKRFVRLEIL